MFGLALVGRLHAQQLERLGLVLDQDVEDGGRDLELDALLQHVLVAHGAGLMVHEDRVGLQCDL